VIALAQPRFSDGAGLSASAFWGTESATQWGKIMGELLFSIILISCALTLAYIAMRAALEYL
jgi:hypothetical protein